MLLQRHTKKREKKKKQFLYRAELQNFIYKTTSDGSEKLNLVSVLMLVSAPLKARVNLDRSENINVEKV